MDLGVWDESNGKLIGIAAIGDSVYNLSVRDKLIGWNVRVQRFLVLRSISGRLVRGQFVY